MSRPKVSIILPVYHEENNLPELIKGIQKFVKTSHETLLVLQDKHDPSLQVAKKLMRSNKNIHVLMTKDGVGMLRALKEGFIHAKANTFIIMMSDLSDNPADIDKMIKMIDNGYDLVCGCRNCTNGKRIGGPVIKGMLSQFACKSLQLLTNIQTHDATNAFKCFRKGLLTKISIESKQGFEFPLELTVKAHTLGSKIGDVPTIWRDRTSGKSKFKIVHYVPFYLRWYLLGIRSKWLGFPT